MATTSDDAAVVNKLLLWIEKNFGGIDLYGLPIVTKIDPSDWALVMNAYRSYAQTRSNRPTASEVNPTAHGANRTTYQSGEKGVYS